jgi:hypothetical protein
MAAFCVFFVLFTFSKCVVLARWRSPSRLNGKTSQMREIPDKETGIVIVNAAFGHRLKLHLNSWFSTNYLLSFFYLFNACLHTTCTYCLILGLSNSFQGLILSNHFCILTTSDVPMFSLTASWSCRSRLEPRTRVSAPYSTGPVFRGLTISQFRYSAGLGLGLGTYRKSGWMLTPSFLIPYNWCSPDQIASNLASTLFSPLHEPLPCGIADPRNSGP